MLLNRKFLVALVGIILVESHSCVRTTNNTPRLTGSGSDNAGNLVVTGVHNNQPVLAMVNTPIRTTSHSVSITNSRPTVDQPSSFRLFSHYNSRVIAQPFRFGLDGPSGSVSASVRVPSTSSTNISSPAGLGSQCEGQTNATSEKQLQAYIASVEALTSTIQELDEAVQQMKPSKVCECMEPVDPSELIDLGRDSSASLNSSVEEVSGSLVVTSEPFTDAPVASVGNRRRRHDIVPMHQPFGMPTTSANNITVVPMYTDQTGEDLARAANDLKSLRKDLSVTADWLRQTNHTVHSAMLRALQAYVTSIERRVDHQRQLYVQTRVTGLKSKIAVIKEKVASLTDRLRSLVPARQNVTGAGVVSREDISASSNSTSRGDILYSAGSVSTTTSTPSTPASTGLTPTREPSTLTSALVASSTELSPSLASPTTGKPLAALVAGSTS